MTYFMVVAPGKIADSIAPLYAKFSDAQNAADDIQAFMGITAIVFKAMPMYRALPTRISA